MHPMTKCVVCPSSEGYGLSSRYRAPPPGPHQYHGRQAALPSAAPPGTGGAAVEGEGALHLPSPQEELPDNRTRKGVGYEVHLLGETGRQNAM